MRKKDSSNAGFTVSHLEGGIIKYFFADATRETMDAFFAATTTHDREAAATGQHLYRIIVLERLLIPTPYGISKIKQADEMTPKELHESLAVVVLNSLAFQLLVIFLNRLSSHAQAVSRFFKDEESARLWLAERKKQSDSEPKSPTA